MATSGADVVVVGGGLAGLAASTFLARAGQRVWLLERAGDLGGRARTRALDGFHLNLGAHALYRGAGLEVLGELGVRVSGGVPRLARGFAFRRGRLHRLPAGALSLLTTDLLSLPERLQAARLLAALPRLEARAVQGITLDEWLGRMGLRPGVHGLLLALARLSTYASAPDRQSAGAAIEQIVLGARGVLYLDSGWQTMVDGLAAAARDAGVMLRGHAPVAGILARGAGVELALESGERVRAAATVLAVPPAVAGALVPGTRLPPQASVRVACLDLALRQLPRPRAQFALGIDRPLYLSVHSAVARLAPEGCALVHLVHYLDGEEAGHRAEMEGLLDLVQPGWRQQALHVRFLPEMTVSHALVTAAAGGRDGRPDVDGLGVPNVFVAGDWVGPTGMLADATLASARRAAHALLARRAGASRGIVSGQVA